MLQRAQNFPIRGTLKKRRENQNTFSSKPMLFFLSYDYFTWQCSHVWTFLMAGFHQWPDSPLGNRSLSSRNVSYFFMHFKILFTQFLPFFFRTGVRVLKTPPTLLSRLNLSALGQHLGPVFGPLLEQMAKAEKG